jgi:hypothetical protein
LLIGRPISNRQSTIIKGEEAMKKLALLFTFVIVTALSVSACGAVPAPSGGGRPAASGNTPAAQATAQPGQPGH